MDSIHGRNNMPAPRWGSYWNSTCNFWKTCSHFDSAYLDLKFRFFLGRKNQLTWEMNHRTNNERSQLALVDKNCLVRCRELIVIAVKEHTTIVEEWTFIYNYEPKAVFCWLVERVQGYHECPCCAGSQSGYLKQHDLTYLREK